MKVIAVKFTDEEVELLDRLSLMVDVNSRSCIIRSAVIALAKLSDLDEHAINRAEKSRGKLGRRRRPLKMRNDSCP
jgi:hypothetical protein